MPRFDTHLRSRGERSPPRWPPHPRSPAGCSRYNAQEYDP